VQGGGFDLVNGQVMDRSVTRAGEASVPADRKLETLTLWQRVYDYLRRAILANRLTPGFELNEVALAASLGVSRDLCAKRFASLRQKGS
jgi:DNA-binding GntR family transcriptional regulator